MQYRTEPVSNRRGLREFLRLPWRIYESDPAWVPPLTREVRRTLDTRRNPYFANATLRLFVCRTEHREPVARVAVVIDRRHRERTGVKLAQFGFFECINDEEALRSLLDVASQYCRSEQVELLEGPFNPNHYSELGLQLDKFGSRPTFFQLYNPAYYPPLLEGYGFRQSARLSTACNPAVSACIRHKLDNTSPRAVYGEYTISHPTLENLGTDLEKLRDVFNDAFSSNWRFLPVSKEEYLYSAKSFRLITDSELVCVIEHKGTPVGALVCVYDVNPLLQRLRGSVGPLKYLRFLRDRRHIRKLIVYAVGVKKAYQHTRVVALLAEQLATMVRGYDALETTWISEEKAPTAKLAAKFGMVPEKYFGIFQMALK